MSNVCPFPDFLVVPAGTTAVPKTIRPDFLCMAQTGLPFSQLFLVRTMGTRVTSANPYHRFVIHRKLDTIHSTIMDRSGTCYHPNHPQEQEQQQPNLASAAMIDAGTPPQDVETTSPSADTCRLITSALAKAAVQTESHAIAAATATTADVDVADTSSNEEIPGSTSNEASVSTSNEANGASSRHRDQEGLPVPQKKSVCFSTRTRGKIIPRYTDEDIRRVWYSKQEQGQMAEDAMRAVTLRRRRSLSEDELNDQHNESIYGLEHCLSKTMFKKCKQEQEDVIDAVLLLQNKMRMEGYIDHEKLFLASDSLSAPARERAYIKGLEYAPKYETRRGTNASS